MATVNQHRHTFIKTFPVWFTISRNQMLAVASSKRSASVTMAACCAHPLHVVWDSLLLAHSVRSSVIVCQQNLEFCMRWPLISVIVMLWWQWTTHQHIACWCQDVWMAKWTSTSLSYSSGLWFTAGISNCKHMEIYHVSNDAGLEELARRSLNLPVAWNGCIFNPG